jgi:transcriptional regulator with XRE-family HTH domain
VRIPRNKYLPASNRGIPVPKTPQTIGGHLRKRRLELRQLQSEVAQQLGVSTVTLSRWETDKKYPPWPHQPAIARFLGYDPFTNPELGMPHGNETNGVASLSLAPPQTFGELLRKRRLESRSNREQFAQKLGITVKTLRSWETNQRRPCKTLRNRVSKFLGVTENRGRRNALDGLINPR